VVVFCNWSEDRTHLSKVTVLALHHDVLPAQLKCLADTHAPSMTILALSKVDPQIDVICLA